MEMLVFNGLDPVAETWSGLVLDGLAPNPALRIIIRMRKAIETSKILMYVERSASKAFGYDIVLRNAGNHFLTDFSEAAIFEDRWELAGQRRSSQPEGVQILEGPEPARMRFSRISRIFKNPRDFLKQNEEISSKSKKFEGI